MIRVGMMSALLGMALALLAACQRADTAGNDPARVSEILDMQWGLVALNGIPVDVDTEDQRPHFSLEANENRMTGYTGCNRMFGSYEINGELLTFSPIGATKMACMDTMDLERDFLKAMEATASYFLAGAELELFDADGTNVARFIARPDTPE